MILSVPEQKKFYKLYYAAVDYMNLQEKILPGVKMNPQYCSYPDAIVLSQAFRKHPEHMATMPYLSKRKLTDEDKTILFSWTRIIPGKFYVVDHTPIGSFFVSEDEQRVYLVLGLRKPLEYLLGDELPVKVSTCLMPFHQKIITDGFLDYCEETITEKQKVQLMKIYADAVKRGTVISVI